MLISKRSRIELRVFGVAIGVASVLSVGGDAQSQTQEHFSWPAYTMPWDTIPEGALNLSHLLDAPAGKHGFVQSRDGKLVFEDGARARFWGVNLVAAAPFPNAQQAEFIAERLARAGCNLVRLHHMDAPWHDRPLINYRRNDSRQLDAGNLDRLDRLIAELKERGIYIHLDLMVHRDFQEGDGVEAARQLENGQKHVSYVNRRMIELQKEYAEQILTHTNPYTGLRYADEPAIAVVMLVNENSIFWTTGTAIPQVYLDEIDERWNAWLLAQYGSRAALDMAWTSAAGEKNLKPDEDPAEGNVARPYIGTWGERYFDERYDDENGPPRAADHFRFLAGLQRSFYDEMTAHLRDIGVRCVIAGTNLDGGVVGLRGNVRQGITEVDVYYGHPRSGFGIPNTFPDVHIANTDPYADKEWGTDAFHIAFSRGRSADVPMLMTEWNEPYPMPYRAEAMPFVASYAAYQDVDGVCLFSYTHENWDRANGGDISGFFNSGNDPALWGLFTAGALIFHRQDVDAGRVVTDIVYSDADLLQPHPNWTDRFKGLSYITRVRQTYVSEAYAGDADLALSSGFTASVDLTGAKHAIVFSRRPSADPYTQEDVLESWFQRYIPEIRITKGSARRVFEDTIWTDERHGGGSVYGFEGYPESAKVDGKDLNGARPAIVMTEKLCLTEGAARFSQVDPSWETRLVLDSLKHWGLSEHGHEMLDREQLISDTGQLVHDYGAGYLAIRTPRTQGIVGHASGTVVNLGDVTVAPVNDFAVILCQSLDGKELGASRHVLVTVVGRVENTGQRWTDARTFVNDGGAPVRVEPIRAELTLLTQDSGAWQGYVLEADGSRAGRFDVEEEPGNIRWVLPEPPTATGVGLDDLPRGVIHSELVFGPSALELWHSHGTKSQ